MLKEIKDVNEKLGIMRITTLNERWYGRKASSPENGLPVYAFFPSSTWVAGYYPKGIFFYKWLAEKGWDEAEAIKQAAGDKGSKVHHACEDLDKGLEIKITDKYLNPSTGQMEELSKEELDCIMSYRDFTEEKEFKLLANEITAFGDGYAGTADKIFAKESEMVPGYRQIWIVDLKTGQSIWPEYELQISSYSHMEINYKALGITDEEWEGRKLAILQIGYRKNGKGYKFTEVDDKYDLFRNVAYKIWQNENPDAAPKERDYPLVIVSKLRQAQAAGQAKEELAPEEEPKAEAKKTVKAKAK